MLEKPNEKTTINGYNFEYMIQCYITYQHVIGHECGGIRIPKKAQHEQALMFEAGITLIHCFETYNLHKVGLATVSEAIKSLTVRDY